jgi:hypothetical protein
MSACLMPSSRNAGAAAPKKARNARSRMSGSTAARPPLDIRDLRSAARASIRFVRRTAVQTTVHIITTGVILALLAGIALKLKVFGPGG